MSSGGPNDCSAVMSRRRAAHPFASLAPLSNKTHFDGSTTNLTLEWNGNGGSAATQRRITRHLGIDEHMLMTHELDAQRTRLLKSKEERAV